MTFRTTYHRTLLEDFFGEDIEVLKKRGMFIIGWGFSYQATDSRTSTLKCDFKFTSGTFNTGSLFKSPSALGSIPYGARAIPDNLSNFIRLGFNYARARKTRLVKVEWLLDLADKSPYIASKIPRYDP